jgi:isorenieratene synthase
MVLDASRAIHAPRGFVVAGRELVAWRTQDGALHVAPAACPHMGADLAQGTVRDDRLICPWHGLALGAEKRGADGRADGRGADGRGADGRGADGRAAEGRGAWRCFPAHDDGVLAWVRLPLPAAAESEPPTEAPILAPRPARAVAAVIRMEARCEPEDVIANRLDPWHGAHYHPHSFAALRVLDADEDMLRLRVSFRVLGPVCVEVDATFHSPEPRTITMTIVEGEGVGSVVESHATPIEPGRTSIVEATLAASDRRGFAIARALSVLVRPFAERRAARLWVEDVAYAERRYALRRKTHDTSISRHRLRSVQ